MTYSSLMVHLDLYQSNDARLHVASDLAEQFDARLIGIAACEPQPAVYADSAMVPTVVEQLMEDAQEKLNQLERRFKTACQNCIKNIEWRGALAQPTDYVAREARAADLVIAGHRETADFFDPFWRLDPSELVMTLGRPLLIVPPGIDQLKLSSIVVGWKDTRESRRAIVDALPLLRRAKEVTVVEIIENDDDRSVAARQVADVAAWLNHQHVDASHRVPILHGNAVEQLESQIGEIGADLIVAGAYGHTRFREWVFGGVTRDMITQARHCAFISH